MRLPTEPPVSIEPAEDLYAIRRKWVVPASRRVSERSLPPLIVRPRLERRTDEEARREPASEPETLQSVPEVERERPERRHYCRRVANVPVILDTRSGEDRRKGARREGDPVVSVDEEA